jgi:hypothetical protein
MGFQLPKLLGLQGENTLQTAEKNREKKKSGEKQADRRTDRQLD